MTRTDWDRLARRAAAIVGEEEPLRLDFDTGRLFVDHAGLALVVHRCPAEATGDPTGGPTLDRRAACSAAHRLVTSQPSYLLATGGSGEQDGVRRLARATVGALADHTGAALVLEVWTPLDVEGDGDIDPFQRRPGFTLYTSDDARAHAAAEALSAALTEIELAGQGADVTHIAAASVAPPGLPPLLGSVGEGDDRAVLLGLAVDAVFLNTREDEFYPRVLDELRDALAPAFAAAAAAFADAVEAPVRPHGRHHLEPAAETVDRGLAACARPYDFLLQVTPVNARAAWDMFRASDWERAPELLYRPLTFDPDTLRRDLFALPIDAVEDPVVAGLLREKRDEIGTEVQMLLDRGTGQFLPGSLRLFGAPDKQLVALAGAVLDRLAEAPAPTEGTAIVGATAFAAEALAELDYYRAQFDGFASSVEVRKDIPGSLMVARGQLLVGEKVSLSAERVPALLAHEIGTHVLTYYNGCAQPLRQLRHGLAGYEPLQEGLAVLAEWLVGGLTNDRMRTLAARVLAACSLVEGAEFVETFRLLRERAGMSDRGAFGVTLRIYRGGGLTKDMVYLRGLRDLLAHLGAGGAYWPLFTGKIALAHLPAVETLRGRGVLGEPPLRPRYASDPAARARLDRAREGLTVLDLL
jgi:uncharacterized protein (TIGR02421 family)